MEWRLWAGGGSGGGGGGGGTGGLPIASVADSESHGMAQGWSGDCDKAGWGRAREKTGASLLGASRRACGWQPNNSKQLLMHGSAAARAFGARVGPTPRRRAHGAAAGCPAAASRPDCHVLKLWHCQTSTCNNAGSNPCSEQPAGQHQRPGAGAGPRNLRAGAPLPQEREGAPAAAAARCSFRTLWARRGSPGAPARRLKQRPRTSPRRAGAARAAPALAARAPATAASRRRPRPPLCNSPPCLPQVVDHYEKPRNVGSFDKADPNVGTGLVGAPACGDVMKLQVRVQRRRFEGQATPCRSAWLDCLHASLAPLPLAVATRLMATLLPALLTPSCPVVLLALLIRSRWTTMATSWTAASRHLAAAPPSPPAAWPPSGAWRCGRLAVCRCLRMAARLPAAACMRGGKQSQSSTAASDLMCC